jgi:hypothetical protein
MAEPIGVELSNSPVEPSVRFLASWLKESPKTAYSVHNMYVNERLPSTMPLVLTSDYKTLLVNSVTRDTSIGRPS